jgi:hypothetical protein
MDGKQEKAFQPRRYAPDNILRLAERHIKRFREFISIADNPDHKGHKFVSMTDSTHYLKLWQSIEGKAGIWELLTDAEQVEVNDALFDEDPEDSEIDA